MFQVLFFGDCGGVQEEHYFTTLDEALEDIKTKVSEGRYPAKDIKLYSEIPLNITFSVQVIIDD